MQHTVGGDESDGRGSTRAQLQPEAGQYGQSMGRKCATGGKWLNFPIVCWRANADLRLQENNGRAWPEVRSSSAFLGANGGSRAGASAVDGAIFRQVAQGSVWGEPSKTRWGTRTRELLSSATAIGCDVLSSRDGERDLGPWGRGGNRGSSRPPKATACQTCASNVAGRRLAQVLSPLQPCSPHRSSRIWGAIPGP